MTSPRRFTSLIRIATVLSPRRWPGFRVESDRATAPRGAAEITRKQKAATRSHPGQAQVRASASTIVQAAFARNFPGCEYGSVWRGARRLHAAERAERPGRRGSGVAGEVVEQRPSLGSAWAVAFGFVQLERNVSL